MPATIATIKAAMSEQDKAAIAQFAAQAILARLGNDDLATDCFDVTCADPVGLVHITSEISSDGERLTVQVVQN